MSDQVSSYILQEVFRYVFVKCRPDDPIRRVADFGGLKGFGDIDPWDKEPVSTVPPFIPPYRSFTQAERSRSGQPPSPPPSPLPLPSPPWLADKNSLMIRTSRAYLVFCPDAEFMNVQFR